MTDYAALYAAVLDRPEDDTPRLVLADYLDDNAGTVPCPGCALDKQPGIPGGLAYVRVGPNSRWASCVRCAGSGFVSDGATERAAFIRVQVELARTSDPNCLHCWPGNGCRYHELRRRERELIEGHADKWFPVPTGYGLDWSIGTDESPGRPGHVVRRGFVSEVRLSLAAFVGGECGRCGGSGHLSAYCTIAACPSGCCPACSGTGRVPGLARELFAAHPLTKCVLTCREPNEDGGEWQWASARDTDGWRFDVHRSSLPWAIAEHLKGGRHVKESRSVVAQWWYDTRDDATADLSAACVRFGRIAAGLSVADRDRV